MRIHTNKHTISTVYAAAAVAGVGLLRDLEHGSRTHKRAFDVILGGSSFYRVNSRGYGSQGHHDNLGNEQAATWDEWGVFLGELFRTDPKMKCWAYESAAHFHAMTGNRFRTLLPVEQRCKLHRWEWKGSIQSCKKGCGATINREASA